ncbi:phage-like protein [Caballeronia temeraria]|uniref:Phage-like protein n=1 Tax=Caballeronia temeraria TaxID=1777137 RepID=A0A157Z5G9_9BURK|nr:phage major capsid protein [Caballeronia temeraria]SAK40663.1 phage-like protein [Caballeronia temeraria]
MLIVTDFARALAAIARCRGNVLNAKAMAAASYGETSKVVLLLQRAIDTGALSLDAGQLADYIGTAPAVSVVGAVDRISPWRRGAPGVPVLVDKVPPTASWRREGAPLVVTNASFDIVRLSGDRSVGGIICYTAEAGRALGDVFMRQLGDDAASAVAAAEGSALFDPDNDGTGDAPESLVHAGITVASTGTSADELRADIGRVLDQFEGDAQRAVWVASASSAARFALLGDGLGNADTTVRGGALTGFPLVAAAGVPPDVLSLVDPSGVVIFDDGLRVDTSEQTLLNTTDDEGATEVLSLWQANIGAAKFSRVADWQAARPASVVTLTGIDWTTPTP